MPAALFLLRAVVLVLMWGLVLAAIVAVRSDFAGGRAKSAQRTPAKAPGRAPASPSRPAAAPKPTTPKSTGKDRKRSNARIVAITAGPLAGTTIPLGEQPITIGRADSSTLVISDDYVSTHHARLVPSGDAWVLEDLGSTNGTFLDRDKVTAPTPVPVGVPIRIGKTTLELRK
jgi:pSer/pThr/pTyr-binding forkhead associated (FHA) protein